MDIEKEREAFVKWFESRYIDDIHPDSTIGIVSWEAWQAQKAQAVPESNALLSAAMDAVQKLGSGGFVLVPVDTLNKALNPNDYDEAVCSANDLLAIIEAQEQN